MQKEWTVGNIFRPREDDKVFTKSSDAKTEASTKSCRDKDDCYAVWNDEMEIVCVFIDGDEYLRKNKKE